MVKRKKLETSSKVRVAKPRSSTTLAISKKLKNGDILEAHGFDEAMIGVGHRCGDPPVAVYDANKCVKILMATAGFDFEEAYDFFSDEVEAAWKGKNAPVWVYPPNSFDTGLY